MTRYAGMAAVLLCAAQAAAAQDDPGTRVLAPFAKCRTVADPTERLACFDRAASALESAVAAKDVTILDRQEIRKTKRSLFGFALPDIALFRGGEGRHGRGGRDAKAERDEEEFTQIDSTVKAARVSGYGRLEITLEDGSVWQTTEALPGPPRAGAAIRVRKGALGNYFLTVEHRSVRGYRIR